MGSDHEILTSVIMSSSRLLLALLVILAIWTCKAVAAPKTFLVETADGNNAGSTKDYIEVMYKPTNRPTPPDLEIGAVSNRDCNDAGSTKDYIEVMFDEPPPDLEIGAVLNRETADCNDAGSTKGLDPAKVMVQHLPPPDLEIGAVYPSPFMHLYE